MQIRRFGFTTSEVARIANEERATIYQALTTKDAWRGIKPRKQLNGRLIWPRGEVFAALGLVPDDDKLAPGVRAGMAILRREAVTISPDVVAALQGLLTHGDSTRDNGIDPDCTLLAELIFSMVERIEAQGEVDPGYLQGALDRLKPVERMLRDALESWEGCSHE